MISSRKVFTALLLGSACLFSGCSLTRLLLDFEVEQVAEQVVYGYPKEVRAIDLGKGEGYAVLGMNREQATGLWRYRLTDGFTYWPTSWRPLRPAEVPQGEEVQRLSRDPRKVSTGQPQPGDGFFFDGKSVNFFERGQLQGSLFVGRRQPRDVSEARGWWESVGWRLLFLPAIAVDCVTFPLWIWPYILSP